MRLDGRRPSARRHFRGCGWRDGWSTTKATALCAPARSIVQGVRVRSPWRASGHSDTDLRAPMLVLRPALKISNFRAIPARVGILYHLCLHFTRFIPMHTLDAIDRKILSLLQSD